MWQGNRLNERTGFTRVVWSMNCLQCWVVLTAKQRDNVKVTVVGFVNIINGTVVYRISSRSVPRCGVERRRWTRLISLCLRSLGRIVLAYMPVIISDLVSEAYLERGPLGARNTSFPSLLDHPKSEPKNHGLLASY